MKDYITTKEAARMAGVSQRTIQNWAKRGRVASKKTTETIEIERVWVDPDSLVSPKVATYKFDGQEVGLFLDWDEGSQTWDIVVLDEAGYRHTGISRASKDDALAKVRDVYEGRGLVWVDGWGDPVV